LRRRAHRRYEEALHSERSEERLQVAGQPERHRLLALDEPVVVVGRVEVVLEDLAGVGGEERLVGRPRADVQHVGHEAGEGQLGRELLLEGPQVVARGQGLVHELQGEQVWGLGKPKGSQGKALEALKRVT
jgi:hypothetical protein